MDTAGMDTATAITAITGTAMVIMDTGMAITGTVIMDMATTTTVMAIGTITIRHHHHSRPLVARSLVWIRRGHVLALDA